jgi:two-component system LytT family response regulator
MHKKTIRTIIVDDEPAARNGMISMLSGDEEIKIVASCKNGIEAIQEIRERKPDLLLLDIQMPGIDGFDVLNNLHETERPYTVFITAYDQFALRAFEIHALDYILKPYTDERFFEMIKRAKNLILQQKQFEQVQRIEVISKKILDERKDLSTLILDADMDQDNLTLSKMVVKEGGKIHFIRLADIRYIEAFDYYVKIHLKDSFVVSRIPLKNIEKQLPEAFFIRVHRSHILNLLHLRRMVKNDSGEYQAILSDGKMFKVSSSYKKHVINRIQRTGIL